MGKVQADVASLTTEANTFDRISGDLTAVRAHVETIAAAAAVNLNSPEAGKAVQAAMLRYNEASDQQIRLLSEISENIQTSGMDYDTTDADNASNVVSSMGAVL